MIKFTSENLRKIIIILSAIPWLYLLISLIIARDMSIKQIRTIIFFLTLVPLIFTPKKFLKNIGNKIKGDIIITDI